MTPKKGQLTDFINGKNNIEKMKDNVDKKIFMNRYYQKEMLTKEEAIDLINHLSGALLIYECSR